ncbi:MAG: 3'(2'),5'-bisphosphate nucleotidase CysQ [Gammaproteobacteria bacterium]|nr:3'(2'),5'-bisphosphate nucleotidase CysQ [Gammaproteobacteria bacterium]
MSIATLDLLPSVIKISENASVEILKYYNSDFSIEEKDDHTPLTSADIAAHQCIVDALKELTPEIPILSEEASNIPFEERKKWNTYWLVDPLDGTREFINKNGEFSVNIALVSDHQPILGVIHVPVNGDCYYATKGNGAYKRSVNGTEKLSVKTTNRDLIVVAGSRSYRDSSLDGFLKNIGNHEIISMGSSIKSCLVAEGTIDIYPRLGPTSEWDTAAAQCIVEEAGGHITDTTLKPLRYNTKDVLLNPHFLVFADHTINWPEYL